MTWVRRVEKDITGETFGKLTAVRSCTRVEHKKLRWLFKCGCGREVIKAKSLVVSGVTRSCGCLRGETAEYED